MTTPDPETTLPPDTAVGRPDPELAADLQAQTAQDAAEDDDGS